MPGMGVARKEATLLEGPRAVNKSVQIGAPETREPPDATVRGLTTTTCDAERAAQTLCLPHLEAYIYSASRTWRLTSCRPSLPAAWAASPASPPASPRPSPRW